MTCVNAATGVSSKSTIVNDEAISSPEVSVELHAGTEGDEHNIQCVVTTNIGSRFQRDLLLMIQTVVTDRFNKQPNDAFIFDVDFSRRLETGDTLASAVAVGTMESAGSDVSLTVIPFVEVISPKAAARTIAGTDGETYLLAIQGTTAAAYVYEKVIRMSVQERP
ncbi:MAG: hypothetical protein E4G97_02815 [Deltaproteobacteria bacterium]|nr:MAG: hypothetical protein E4G97_02815 [Deltaproteobacteria bacterium]